MYRNDMNHGYGRNSSRIIGAIGPKHVLYAQQQQ